MQNLLVTTIQTNLIWENKAQNLANLTQKINAITQPTQIIILPEMFTTGFSMQPQLFAETIEGPTVQWMQQTAAQKNAIITGSFICQDGGKYYNRLMWVLPNGQTAHYNKRHLFAFAGENNHYTAGQKRLIAQVNGWRLNLQICYDLRFPVWARNQIVNGQPEYDVLLYVANWPERRQYPWQQLAIARAIENQCYVIAVNRIGADGNGIAHSGCSMVINPLGEVLYKALQTEATDQHALNYEQLQEVRTKFPFLADADDFLIQHP
jgi:omega-amidase